MRISSGYHKQISHMFDSRGAKCSQGDDVLMSHYAELCLASALRQITPQSCLPRILACSGEGLWRSLVRNLLGSLTFGTELLSWLGREGRLVGDKSGNTMQNDNTFAWAVLRKHTAGFGFPPPLSEFPLTVSCCCCDL